MNSREQILQRVRAGLGRRQETAEQRAERVQTALSYVQAAPRGPHPSQPHSTDELVAAFTARATELACTVASIDGIDQVPQAVKRYLDEKQLHGDVAIWPEFMALDWSGLTHELAPLNAEQSKIGVTGCVCAIAETGTVMLLTGASTPMTHALLPETHIVVVQRDTVVLTMEEAFSLLRKQSGVMPRGLHFISGPSRTADIAQTLVIGAHGPYRVHLLVAG